jgi:hypothetical protein
VVRVVVAEEVRQEGLNGSHENGQADFDVVASQPLGRVRLRQIISLAVGQRDGFAARTEDCGRRESAQQSGGRHEPDGRREQQAHLVRCSAADSPEVWQGGDVDCPALRDGELWCVVRGAEEVRSQLELGRLCDFFGSLELACRSAEDSESLEDWVFVESGCVPVGARSSHPEDEDQTFL